jgi:hypothetical protein
LTQSSISIARTHQKDGFVRIKENCHLPILRTTWATSTLNYIICRKKNVENFPPKKNFPKEKKKFKGK